MAELDFDAVDRHILAALQENARVSNSDIARDLGMTPSAIIERIRKLEQRGVILGYEARLAPKSVGRGLTAFVTVRAEEPGGAPATARALEAVPEILEVHQVAGDDCFLVKLRARDTDDLARILRERLTSLPQIRGTRTSIVLGTVKETNRIPLD